MIITEIGIENFGKLSGYRVKLTDGLNSFLHENGYGKTTVTYFIKAMLYGLEQTTRQSLFENERRRFAPWGGGSFGGFMCFKVGSRTYRVERSFGSKLSEDTFALYDTATSLPSSDYSSKLGEELFGIDADGFERTVFISEKLIDGENKNSTVAAKLSDLSGVEGDLSNFDDAVNSIDKQIKVYKKKGGGGILRDTERLISDADKELEEIKKASDAARRAEDEIALLKTKRDELLKEKGELEKRRESAVSARTAEVHRQRHLQMLADIEARRRELSELSEFFARKLPSDEETYFASDNMAKYERCMSILAGDVSDSALTRVVEFIGDERGYEKAKSLIDKCEKTDIAERELREYEVLPFDERRASKPSLYLFGAAALLLLISLPLVFLFASAIPFTLSAAVLLFALALFAKKAERRESSRTASARSERISELTEKYESAKRERDALFSEFIFPEGISEEEKADYVRKNLASYKIAKESLDTAAKRHDELLESALSSKARAEEFLALFPTESERPFDEIRTKRARYDYLKISIEREVRDAEEYARVNGLEKAESTEAYDMGEISEAAACLDGKILENERELTEKRAFTENCYRICERADEIKDRRDELSAKLDGMNKKYFALTKAKELLSEAKARISAKYIGPTQKNFVKYMELIDGECLDTSIDTAFTVTKTDGGATRAYDSYSKGTRDMMTLAVRLALCDSLYDGERPPLILDDPYCALDDRRASAAKDVLKKLAKDRQILYFTCSSSRAVK